MTYNMKYDYPPDIIDQVRKHVSGGGTIKSFAEKKELDYAALRRLLNRQGFRIKRQRGTDRTIVGFPCQVDEKAMIDEACKYIGVSVSSFSKDAVLSSAAQVLESFFRR